MLGNVEIILLLFSYGASPTIYDRNGNTALHLCVKSHNDESVLHHLLSHPQIKEILNSMDYEGKDFLIFTSVKKRDSKFEFLMEDVVAFI